MIEIVNASGRSSDPTKDATQTINRKVGRKEPGDQRLRKLAGPYDRVFRKGPADLF
jgi:hypothetical protein